MINRFKILTSYIKDMSSETPNVETFIFVKENINKYQLNIDINSKAIKNKMIEIDTILKFEDKEESKNKSFFELTFTTIIQINVEIQDKKEIEKIVLCDAQIKIYPELEKSFLNLLHNSGYPDVKFEKKVDFEQLYNQRLN